VKEMLLLPEAKEAEDAKEAEEKARTYGAATRDLKWT